MVNPWKDIKGQITGQGGENPKKKLEVLEESKNSGLVSKEEFEKEKEKIHSEIKEFESKPLPTQKEDSEEDPKTSSERNLIIAIVALIIVLIAIFGYFYYFRQEPKTLEELHIENLQGKLDPGLGYVYGGVYSFIFYDGQWFTQLNSPKGTKQYGIAMRYSPRDLQNFSIRGGLSKQFFDNQTDYYITFNPLIEDQKFTVLAVADLNSHLTRVFEKNPIAACDRNETFACSTRPIVTCSDKDKLVFQFGDSERLNVVYNGTCILIEGTGLDFVRGVDKVLYNLYGIMGQE